VRLNVGHASILRENGSQAVANVVACSGLGASMLRGQPYKLPNMPEHVPDKVDRAILTQLQRDGRMANIDLADAVGLSPSACLRRVKALEADGVIAGYRAEVSRARATFAIRTILSRGPLPLEHWR
jgi:hypothetical protein